MTLISESVRISGSDINVATKKLSQTTVISVDEGSGEITIYSQGSQRTITPRLSNDGIKSAWKKATASNQEI
jgi:hypothetical protein